MKTSDKDRVFLKERRETKDKKDKIGEKKEGQMIRK